MDTKEQIVALIMAKKQVTAKDLADHLDLSRQIIHRHLNDLVAKKQLQKIGQPPKVFYLLSQKETESPEYELDPLLQKTIRDNFLLITPSGEKKDGVDGFVYWCQKQKLPLDKTAQEYQQTIQKYAAYKKDGLIDGRYKLKQTFPHSYLDQIYYLDFYTIERFGKTKLGQLLLYAKQSQDKKLIKELAEQIKPPIAKLITKFNVQAVGFIPPTVKREVQLMQELKRQLDLNLSEIQITKVKTPIIVAQKTLTKLSDRVENARDTIVVSGRHQYSTLLLIDDALGSGATMNETAKKIKEQGLASNIIGLAITGSFSGFEVISEV